MWISWINNILISGQTCININDNLTSYFKCKKYLRQRDPLFPFLFNLVSDTLSKILTNAMSARYIKGLGNFNGKSILNLNFADDTLIFIQADFKMVEALGVPLH
jgi:Reverse transcriptase (RNA-dependent DNA polymerase)